eukprot:Skav234938  [mRNA]  locus=scaffold2677:156166:162563:- [translate_table: standard]
MADPTVLGPTPFQQQEFRASAALAGLKKTLSTAGRHSIHGEVEGDGCLADCRNWWRDQSHLGFVAAEGGAAELETARDQAVGAASDQRLLILGSIGPCGL